MKQEVLSWEQVDQLVDVMLPALKIVGAFDAMVLVTRGGIVPGGLLAEALGIRHILTAAVDFPGDGKFWFDGMAVLSAIPRCSAAA